MGKKKTKVWVDVDKVIKASTVPKKLRWYEQLLIEVPKRVQWLVEVMEEVPKGEKASS